MWALRVPLRGRFGAPEGVGLRDVVAVSAAFTCLSCGARPMCPLPPDGTPQGTFVLQESHEFGADYDVLSVTYYLDDCIVEQSNDTALLQGAKVDFPTHTVPAGSRQFRYAIKFKSGFSADMHDYEWGASGGGPIEVPEGGTLRVIVRMFERKEADPRKRMTIMVQSEKSSVPPIEAEAK